MLWFRRQTQPASPPNDNPFQTLALKALAIINFHLPTLISLHSLNFINQSQLNSYRIKQGFKNKHLYVSLIQYKQIHGLDIKEITATIFDNH
jgi:hypothetical protein